MSKYVTELQSKASETYAKYQRRLMFLNNQLDLYISTGRGDFLKTALRAQKGVEAVLEELVELHNAHFEDDQVETGT